jgi:eukaryotic-like serine/threonine-protein kinase
MVRIDEGSPPRSAVASLLSWFGNQGHARAMNGAALQASDAVLLTGSRLGCRVLRELGQGGQGSVYEVSVDGGESYALKWYGRRAATAEQRRAIERLVAQGPPSDSFLWPIDVAEAPGHDGFGYLMPLRPQRYHDLNALMRNKLTVTFRTLATVGRELAINFHEIHSRGLCYRDISLGNVFFDPGTGAVLICDNDNVGVDGVAPASILGTPRFMAPEIVRGEALPSTSTDLYSLAVLLFHVFMVHHPLLGRRELDFPCWDAEAEATMYGFDPRFVFHPHEDANRLLPDHAHAAKYWDLYPQHIRDLFTRSFVEGLEDPLHGRVGETEWRNAMIELRDAIMYCPGCTAENFYDARDRGRSSSCWNCGTALDEPVRLRVRRGVVVLNHDTVLYPHHIDLARSQDFGTPVASVVQHPSGGHWGLRNQADRPWVAVDPSGATHTIAPGRTVSLLPGLRISFGGAEAEVLA